MSILKEISHRDFNNVLDPLASATRDQLWAFAKKNGIDFDHRTTPARTMELVLRERGLTNIPVEPLRLGMQAIPAEMDRGQPAARTVNVDDELLARYRQKQPEPNPEPAPAVEVGKMSMWQLRVELKKRGIKFSRTDKMDKLREILSREQAAS